MPIFVATLATNHALADLRIFLKTLALWNSELPTIYMFTDSPVEAALPSLQYPGQIIHKNVLQQYSGINRSQMEKIKGQQYGSLWFDFQAEKINLLQWAFDSGAPNVFFFDSDICFFAPLPKIPDGTLVALSPHLIRPGDEARFGKYNGGFLWMGTSTAVEAWRAACPESRFFEQAALECFNSPEWKLYEFPIQHNYGWWRLWQGRASHVEMKAGWSINRNKSPSGILVNGEPLCSVHTHWTEKGDLATAEFNQFVLNMLGKLQSSHAPAKKLLQWCSY
jgi:hypothetical protein